ARVENANDFTRIATDAGFRSLPPAAVLAFRDSLASSSPVVALVDARSARAAVGAPESARARVSHAVRSRRVPVAARASRVGLDPGCAARRDVAPPLRKPFANAVQRAALGRAFTTHGLRHTLDNALRKLAAGNVVRAITRHATERMTEHDSWIDGAEK